MKTIRDISEFEPKGELAISIGNFDGIHAGHRLLLAELCRMAKRKNVPAAVVTFDPHPVEVLNPGVSIPRLTTLERRAELLEQCGIDYMIALKADQRFLSRSHVEFFQMYVVEKLNATAMVEGPNFFFGKNRTGTTQILSDLCDQHGIDLSIIELREAGQEIISSSKIRQLISNGQVEKANELLVSFYQLSGRVESGEARGRQLGFPTANLAGIQVLMPGEGVYAGRTLWENDWIPSAVHIGPNPTFAEVQRKVEVHLIGQDLSLYGQELKVQILKKIRGIQKFSGREELVVQIDQDLKEIESCLKSLE